MTKEVEEEIFTKLSEYVDSLNTKDKKVFCDAMLKKLAELRHSTSPGVH